jgi:nucleoside-diphosphate-sugar epimerase
MRERRVFVAGSTGAVGTAVMRLGQSGGLPLVPHLRPKHAAQAPAGAAVFDLSDEKSLDQALSGCTTVLQLIGTMRKRFSTGDTYDTSDIGTTVQLVESAKRSGVDHFVLLSSVGAGSPRGAYLKAKARAEAIVRESGLAFTIVRPSMLVGPGRGFRGAEKLGRLLGPTLAPIRIEELAAALLWVAREREALGAVLEGKSLWDAVARAGVAARG